MKTVGKQNTQAGTGPSLGAQTSILITSARIFDGKNEKLAAGMSVLTEGNKISRIARSIRAPAGSTVIDAGGRVLMPGLIDAHMHMFSGGNVPSMLLLTAELGYITLVAAKQACATLLRGFTTVRDCGGPAFDLKKAIDDGIVNGPRIYPSGAVIIQTAGHNDHRNPSDLPRTGATPPSRFEKSGGVAIADGPDEVRRRTRENLMLSASQIKLMAGGGVSSRDQLDVTQYSEDEIRAAVGAAEDWGTYVAVHAYTSRAIQRAIRAGVMSIEHGNLADEATVKLMAEKGVWWCLQPFLNDEDYPPKASFSPSDMERYLQLTAGTDACYKLAKKHGVKVAWGTDVESARSVRFLTKMVRWYTPAAVLQMATSTNAELLSLSGKRNPYPGKLGMIEEGAYADILLVNKDPLEDISILGEPDGAGLAFIMKDGKIYKNTIS
jgi:imidazolonepropionase-like amidohydrolase